MLLHAALKIGGILIDNDLSMICKQTADNIFAEQFHNTI